MLYEGLPTELQARLFAETAHGDQRYGSHPYLAHLQAVRAVMEEVTFSSQSMDVHDLRLATWLHDVIEDAHVSRWEIEQKFGVKVSRLVWAVTGQGGVRRERAEDAYQKIRKTPNAVILKLCDRIANVEASRKSAPSLFRMYKKEASSFRQGIDGAPWISSTTTWNEIRRLWDRLEILLQDP